MSLSLLFEVVYLYSYQDCVVHNQKMWQYIYRKKCIWQSNCIFFVFYKVEITKKMYILYTNVFLAFWYRNKTGKRTYMYIYNFKFKRF